MPQMRMEAAMATGLFIVNHLIHHFHVSKTLEYSHVIQYTMEKMLEYVKPVMKLGIEQDMKNAKLNQMRDPSLHSIHIDIHFQTTTLHLLVCLINQNHSSQ